MTGMVGPNSGLAVEMTGGNQSWQRRRRFRLAASWLCVTLVAGSIAAQEEPVQETARLTVSGDAAVASLTQQHRRWLISVAGLISVAERDVFLGLRSDYRRDAFIQAFWELRDPDPRTPRNELRERFEAYVNAASDNASTADPRVLLFLLNGPPGRWSLPDGRGVARCFSRTRELEIWFYGGSEKVGRRFAVIFVRRARGVSYSVWIPGEPLRPVQRSKLPTQDIRQLCGDELLRYATGQISLLANYDRLLEEVLTPPRPSPEWLANIARGGTDLPEGTETFSVGVGIDFPGRNQSRTALRVKIGVPRSEAPGRRFDDVLFHSLLLTGEVIRDGRLFESFDYRFEGPTPEEVNEIALGFTRYLRRGQVTLRVLIEDVYSGRYAQVVRELDIPSPEGRPSLRTEIASREVATGPSLRLGLPPGAVQVGLVRFSAQAAGELDRVVFYLDERQMLSKRTRPYSVELDLGSTPAPHQVRVVGLRQGREVATDQVWLNQGAQRFRVRMIEPRPGGIYPAGFTARVQVDTPAGQSVQRVELYVNDDLAATIEEAPYARGLMLRGLDVALVRAVAYLSDGTTAEDGVVINTADFSERIEVRLVELSVLVVNRDGTPVAGLDRGDFRILDQGVVQEIQRFEWTREVPVQVALLVDRSASMEAQLDTVGEAALALSQAALSTAEDRVAVLSFSGDTSIDVGFTASVAEVERALAGLRSAGGTALYDALASGLNSFEGVRGAKAVVLFTDGQDEDSRLSYEQVLETARRTGVVVYAVAPEAAFADRESRSLVERLAAETGGRAFFLDGLSGLQAVYSEILHELRSRYLLAFQPSETGAGTGFREIRVEVDRPGAVVRTRSGYTP